MLTFQDFEKATDKLDFLQRLIAEHRGSEIVATALIADEYDKQRNTTINTFIQKIYTLKGKTVENKFATNNKRASNFFRLLNRQRCMFLLGNGVTLTDEGTKERLGKDFDTQMQRAGYKALIHGITFVFMNLDKVHVFPVTEFAPLWDEESGVLRAGVRYWQLDSTKPLMITLYEKDGYTTYRKGKDDKGFVELKAKRSYKQKLAKAPADEVPEVVGEENYSALPIVPFWGSELKQSTLIGMREGIDSYDLISNGLCNDLRDCARVFMILENYGGMNDEDLAQFRDRLVTQHIATADTQNGGKVTPYTQEIPFEAVEAYLNRLKQDIYGDFGALNVVDLSAAQKTATEIEAAYQPLDDAADDFEYQMIAGIQQILVLIGVEDTPTFKRNRVSNQLEAVQMIAMEAPWLDEETILELLPNVPQDRIKEILQKLDEERQSRFVRDQNDGFEDEPDTGGEA